jgi:hypothetical protein
LRQPAIQVFFGRFVIHIFLAGAFVINFAVKFDRNAIGHAQKTGQMLFSLPSQLARSAIAGTIPSQTKSSADF